MNLVDSLIQDGWLKTPEIIKAFRKIKREDFLALRSLGEGGLPEGIKNLAELNEALPIGFNQTISQPLTVAFMLELLQPKEGDKILDVGAGSGWTTALLAYCVSQKGNFEFQNGKVIAIEIVQELAKFGEKNVAKYGFIEKGIVEYVFGDGSKGFKKEAPYDKIIASASAEAEVPSVWKEQLKVKGRLVCPIGHSIYSFVKKSKDEFEKKEFPGFIFVPLVKN
ncbi:MAG: protein-L-isoaspartate(D-aspartate) O-methyltransferase [Parcubacteria group bacterium Licking1014_1]|nr:MAG: protein-L-isoaspartate(D-aspartate) O-methyltransferase [Parcubacteria group bacterium Licking1014_1]